ncbi:unnamed protein product [Hymenolepis diminuta]|uniref:Uncharacterized protein n=1 Tax=Hymenolepis diminuta TaxID=6216 RepID=A0A564YGY2_HYMDI|nr:unnamed protein product [Hymenolepis diminuta]
MLQVICIPLSDLPAGCRFVAEFQVIFGKEVGDLFQQLQFIQLIETQKIQATSICYEALCSNLLITATNLTVKFISQFQDDTRSHLGCVVCRFRLGQPKVLHVFLGIKVMSMAVSNCSLTFLLRLHALAW